MSITLYNSLTKKKEDLSPQAAPLLTMYSCGVTVYDDCHIGHGRSLYIFEVIRRYLKYRGYNVLFVRNITDIDDKIINRANELKVDWKDLVKKYIEHYYDDMKSLGIPKADVEPCATDNIPGMIAHIEKLIDKNYAYATESGVYFNVRAFAGYGKLSGQSIEAMLTGVRKESDENKLDPLDFALWKKSKPGEPSWPSPWGAGRPGWHIECSVMSTKYLRTDTIDIHAGGRDLIFPHHENEIAQAEALTGRTFATHWIHHGLLTINGQKMSKSLGNFITIKDALKKYHPDVIKIFFLQAHYSSPIDFSDKKMEEAGQAYERML
ncbi:MAG: cysteine--tRNA ligase, partial [Candidatus Omnitrophota bacterium]